MRARYSHNSVRSTVPLTVHLSEGLAESLDTFCARVGKSRSEVIREAVTQYLMNQALTECKEA